MGNVDNIWSNSIAFTGFIKDSENSQGNKN